MGIGAGCLIIVVIGGIVGGFFARRIVRLNREASQFADASVVAIVSGWSEKALIDRASPELAEELNEEITSRATFDSWRKLGKLVKYHGSKPFSLWTMQKGAVTTGIYVGTAEFQDGIANIKIGLIKQDGAWRIAQFAVYGQQLFGGPADDDPNVHRLLLTPRAAWAGASV